MESSTKDNSLRVVIKKLSSIRLTITLLFVIAGLSVIGTLIPQGLQQIEYVQRYGFTFYRFLNFFGFLDIYHTWYFNGIIGLLAVNLIVCSFDRLPKVYKNIKIKRTDMSDAQISSLPFYRELKLNVNPEDFSKHLTDLLSTMGGKTLLVKNSSSSITFFWEKGILSRFGPYITHLGIVIILVGALIGSIYGFRANVNIIEGGTVNKVYDFRRGVEIPLGFEVKCDDFNLEFYPGTNRPKRYASTLEIIENGKVMAQKTIEVNTPLTYKGLTFYQSSYGPAAPPSFDVTVYNKNNRDSKNLTLELDREEKVFGNVYIRIIDYAENYSGFGPAALVEIRTGEDNTRQFPIFQNFKDLADAHSPGNYKVMLNRLLEPEKYYTGLQVTKDPGVNIVWLGSFIMSIGLLFAFLIYHRRIWVKVVDRNGKKIVLAGGTSFKNKIGFEKEFNKLITSIEKIAQEGRK